MTQIVDLFLDCLTHKILKFFNPKSITIASQSIQPISVLKLITSQLTFTEVSSIARRSKNYELHQPILE